MDCSKMLHKLLIISYTFLIISFAFAGDAKIDGTVSDDQGIGLAGVAIKLKPEDPNYLSLTTKTKKNGKYFFAFVKPGNYSFHLEMENYVMYEAEIIIRDSEKKIIETTKGRLPLDKPAPPIGIDSDSFVTLNFMMKPKAEVDRELAGMKTPDVLSLLNASKFQEALDLTKEILMKDPENAAILYLQANAFYYLQDLKNAEESLSRAMQCNPKQEGVHFLLGKIYYETGRSEESQKQFNEELEISSENKEIRGLTYLNLGIVYSDRNENEKAAQAFEKAIELNPTELAAYNELAIIYTRMSMPEKAEEVMSRIKGIGSENPDIFYNLGVNYYNSKNYAKAVEEFEKTIAIKPDYALAHKYLAFALINTAEIEKALTHLKKYLELSPEASDKAEIEQYINGLEKK